ncbi:hypothetical protein [Jiangella mangrovi]|uniref:Uncharacterized protein n=1 Tax=Jiangella mangrovi TaxID=1524084 RepID=A0A7W9GY99_9ACTN|nr:hypothetical protein [Jiangella mangrovi]MBB5792001.1 hypothetical protein [Jiangella mangrovi]
MTAPAGAMGAVLPGWTLRVALGASVLVTVLAVAGWTSVSPFALALAVLVGGVAVALPVSHMATAFLALCGLCGLAADGAITGWLSLAVLGAHATHVTAALAAVVPAGAPVERGALRPSLERFILAQAAGQLVVLLAWALT